MSSIDRTVPLAILAVAVAGAVLLSGCATDVPASRYQAFKGPDKTALDQYAVKVTPAPDELGIAPHMAGLSPAQQEALGAFAERWRDSGDASVSLRRPANAKGDDTEALRATAMIVEYLIANGVPADTIRQTAYPTAEAGAPILLRFTALKVETPDCSKLWDNLTSTNANGVSKHFGCAMIANAAVQVADPRDLTRPVGMAPSDATRRSVVIGKYREGKITGAEKDEQSSAAVSTAVK